MKTCIDRVGSARKGRGGKRQSGITRRNFLKSAGALILYWNDIAYSTPGGKAAVERVLGDESEVPLIVSIDILMGETTAFADYILPDTTYLERWSTPHVGSAINAKVSGVRQPAVGSLDAQMNYTPVLPNTKTMEDIHIGLANAMGLDMTGQDKDGNPVTIERAWDWHRQLIANIAGESGGVGGGALDEAAAIDYVLARGGRFEDYTALYDGDQMAHQHNGMIFFFNETLAQTKDSITGELYDGFGKYAPVADVEENPIDDAGYSLTLLTYKQAWHSMARTINNPWLVSILPDHIALELNYIAHLCYKEQQFASTGDEAHLTRAWEMERDFLASHLIPWIPLLRDKVCEKTQHPYFRIMAELAKDVTQNDLTALENLLGPSQGHAVPNYD